MMKKKEVKEEFIYYESLEYTGLVIGVLDFKKKIIRKEMRKAVHHLFEESVVERYGLKSIKNNEKIKNLIHGYSCEKKEILNLYSSFSYTDNIAVFIYSDIYDVSIDIENKLKVESLELFFFKLEDNLYKKIGSDAYKIKTLSWCIQEALGKLERTGLKEKHIVSNIEKYNNCFEIQYYSTVLKELKTANMIISKINEFYLVINFRRV